ncbi:MAG TPA: class I SAM-dependent methyltransferase [Acidimicrobiales bacterium]|nr:class I SAM-dependent methyltransferase [Acidimicrobiales bacterium]
MRAVTRQIAFEPTGWTAKRRTKVADLFDSLAPTWHEREAIGRPDPLQDALDRGGPFARGSCLELGSGVGLMTPTLVGRFGDRALIAVDLAPEMLTRAPATTPRVLADSAQLPFPDRTIATIALVNMFLFPAEVDRLLRADGALIWVSTVGDATPIYLPPDDVLTAMPGAWQGVAADAGWGSWVVLRRA